MRPTSRGLFLPHGHSAAAAQAGHCATSIAEANDLEDPGGDAIIQHNIPLDPNVIMLEYHTETYSDCQSALVVVTELTAKPSIDSAGLKRSTQEQAREHSV